MVQVMKNVDPKTMRYHGSELVMFHAACSSYEVSCHINVNKKNLFNNVSCSCCKEGQRGVKILFGMIVTHTHI